MKSLPMLPLLGRGGSDLNRGRVSSRAECRFVFYLYRCGWVSTRLTRILSPSARRLDKVSYEEMLELASLGAKVSANTVRAISR